MSNFNRGWAVQYKDGTVVKEPDFNGTFRMLPQQRDIVSVLLKFEDRVWLIKNKENYFEYKTMSMLAGGMFSQPIVEARHIGYWEDNKKIIYSLNERTGELTIHTAEA